MQKKIAILRKEIAILEKKLGEALDILLQPARQPPALEKVIKGLKKPLDILQKLLQSQLEEQVDETHRVGPDTLRLAPLYTWRGVRKGNYALDQLRTAENELDDERKPSSFWFPNLLRPPRSFSA